MKTDDLSWGVRSAPPPAPNALRVPKWGLGVLEGSPKTKYAQNYYLGIVKKFQNNRISHFLPVDFQKNGGQI